MASDGGDHLLGGGQAPQQVVVFKGWSHPKAGDDPEEDPELLKLEQDMFLKKKQLYELREKGRQHRLVRLEAMDALETKRVTLMEIYKRMEKELIDKDVFFYGDVLAEVFGERKIFAHRAIGLESLLCQFMHQMLAKQHQMKILKKTAKELQDLLKEHKFQNRNEFHSYEALAVQLEASRLSLEAQYDDIFAAQHALLAQLKHVEAGGTMTNYKVVTPPPSQKRSLDRKPSLSVSTRHRDNEDDDLKSSNSKSGSTTPDAFADGGENDYDTAMDVLKDDNTHSSSSRNNNKGEEEKKDTDNKTTKPSDMKPVDAKPTPASAGNSSITSPRRTSDKSARERRREIEHLRQARVIGGGNSSSRTYSNMSSTSLSMDDDNDGDEKPSSTRARMRELELVRKRASVRSAKDKSPLSPRGSTSASSRRLKLGDSADEEEEKRRQEERRERRKQLAAARRSKTGDSPKK